MAEPYIEIDLNQVRENYYKFKKALPKVDVYYAVKANPCQDILDTLGAVGCNFDVASWEEYNLCKNTGGKTIYTHPIKSQQEIDLFGQEGVNTFVVDNQEELKKLPRGSNILIRVKSFEYDCDSNLSKKFGCERNEVSLIVHDAIYRELFIKGFCFHVGSNISTNQAYIDMLNYLKEVYLRIYETIEYPGSLALYDEKKAHLCLSRFDTLDIGGGFPHNSNSPIDIVDFCHPINEELEWFIDRGIQIMAEPGRYIVANAARLTFHIIGKNKRDDKIWYYANDGVYGSFLDCLLSGYRPSIFPKQEAIGSESVVLAGPTCDSIDVIYDNIMLPPNLQNGDALIAEDVGAYVIGLSTRFNGLYKTKIIIKK